MRFSAVSVELKKLQKKHKTRFILSSILTFFCIIFIITSIVFHESSTFASMIFFVMLFTIIWPVFILQWITTIWLNRAIKKIGINLIVSIDDDKLILEDIYGNKPIKITHDLKNIEVLPHVFAIKIFVLCDVSGLLIITDKKKFFKTMSDKYHKRLEGYQQRVALLESGFFISCTRVNALLLSELISQYNITL